MVSKVFGIGLNKTGTKTLALILSSLGLRHMGYRRDLLMAFREGRMHDIFAVTDEFQSFEDWPYPLIYKDLFLRYPDSLFILTLRKSPTTWLNSLKRHSLRSNPRLHGRMLAYGYDYPFGYEGEHLKIYESHATEVESFFRSANASNRLFKACWETGTSVADICNFLGIRSPHANRDDGIVDRARFRENVRRAHLSRTYASSRE